MNKETGEEGAKEGRKKGWRRRMSKQCYQSQRFLTCSGQWETKSFAWTGTDLLVRNACLSGQWLSE